MKSAFNKSEEHENNFQLLGNIGDSLFLNMKDVYMFALVVGYNEKQRLPFSKYGGDSIKSVIFDDNDKNIMDIIAIGVTNDVSILLKENEDEKYKIIEEYTNGGMSIIVNKFCKPIPSFEDLKKFVQKYAEESKMGNKVDITDLIDELSN